MRRSSKYFIACSLLLIPAFLLLLNAQYSGQAINRWTSAANMATARAAACTALLPDGRVLVAGGNNGSSVVASVEIYGVNGAFSVAASMHAARAGAACATLQDGRVFVAGGNDGTSALRSAEIYDPAMDAWTSVGGMNAARSGHTAALLPWGAVLLVGGDGKGVVEAYNVVRGDFQVVGSLSSARKSFALAAFANHKVAIAGGSDGSNALSPIDIVDFDARTITPAGSMLVARTNFAAAPMLDGRVLFTGGLDASGNALATSEIFDPATGESVAGPNLSEPRANHQAYALPGNGGILLMGGTNATTTLASTDRYSPRTGAFASAAAMNTARNAHALALPRAGALLVAGGRNATGALSSTESYGFATLAADKGEYFPGETASFTGAGWKPGEQIMVQVSALPVDDHKVEFTGVATADGSGRVHLSGFNVDQSHMGVKFQLSGTGLESQTDSAFADNDTTSVSLVTPVPASGTTTYPTGVQVTGTVNNLSVPGYWVNDTTYSGVPLYFWIDSSFTSYSTSVVETSFAAHFDPGDGTAFIPPGNHTLTFEWSNGAGGACSPHLCNASSASISYTVANVNTVTTAGAPATVNYGVAATLTAVVSVNANSYSGYPSGGGASVTFVSGSTLYSCGTWVDGPAGTSTCSMSVILGAQGSYNFFAGYGGGNGFNNSASAATQNITVVSPAATYTALTPYGGVSDAFGTAHTFTASVGFQGEGGDQFPGQTTYPTGTVSFVDIATGATLAVANVVDALDGVGIASVTVNDASACPSSTRCLRPLAGGAPHQIRAEYTPASGNGLAPSDDTVATGDAFYTVTKISPNWGIYIDPEPSLVGANITVTATAAAVLGITPTGTATLAVSGASVGAAQSINNGVVVYNYTMPAAGTVAIGVTYGGDSVFNAQAGILGSGGDAINHVTISGATTTTVTTTPPTPVTYGSLVTYSAAVSSPAGGEPTGTVHFYDNGADVTGCTAATLNSAAVASCAPSTPPAPGAHPLTATYNPTGSTYLTSTSVTYTLQVNKAQAGEAFTAFSPASITYGTAINAHMVLTPVGGVPAGSTLGRVSGTVSLYQGSTLLATSSSFGVGDGAHDIAVALPSSIINSPGTYTLNMQYSGDANYNASVPPYVQQTLTVTKAPTTTTPTWPSSAVAYGATVNLPVTVTVNSPASGTPTGTVTATSGSVTLASGTLSGGSATLTFVANQLAQGNNTVAVTYSGDANFATSSATDTTFAIATAGTTTAVTSSPNPSTTGQSVNFTVTVTSATSGTPTGLVGLFDGATSIGLPGTLSGGTATIAISTLATGSPPAIRAEYIGDTNFSESYSSSYLQTVGKGAVTAAVTSSLNPSSNGQQVTFTATIAPVAPGAISRDWAW